MGKDKTYRTSFGTILVPLEAEQKTFGLKEDYTANLDTPIETLSGTKKTFIKNSNIDGIVAGELDLNVGKKRQVLVVSDENGRYLIPLNKLSDKVEKSVDEVEKTAEDLLNEAKDKVEDIVENNQDVLNKEYFGFKVKQILFISALTFVIVKIFK